MALNKRCAHWRVAKPGRSVSDWRSERRFFGFLRLGVSARGAPLNAKGL